MILKIFCTTSIVIICVPKCKKLKQKNNLNWNIHFLFSRQIENRNIYCLPRERWILWSIIMCHPDLTKCWHGLVLVSLQFQTTSSVLKPLSVHNTTCRRLGKITYTQSQQDHTVHQKGLTFGGLVETFEVHLFIYLFHYIFKNREIAQYILRVSNKEFG